MTEITDTVVGVREGGEVRNVREASVRNAYTLNAVEHGGEEITVHVGGMSDSFYVADTGPGIPEAEREEIFGADYSTSADGTELGLWIVEQTVEAHTVGYNFVSDFATPSWRNCSRDYSR